PRQTCRRSGSGADTPPPISLISISWGEDRPALAVKPAFSADGKRIVLLDRLARHRAELAYQPVGHLPGDRDLAVALELLDCCLGIGADRAGRLQLTVAVFGQRTL